MDEDLKDTFAAWRSLLSQLHQRQPKALQAASQDLIQENEEHRDAIEQLLLSLTVVRVVFSKHKIPSHIFLLAHRGWTNS